MMPNIFTRDDNGYDDARDDDDDDDHDESPCVFSHRVSDANIVMASLTISVSALGKRPPESNLMLLKWASLTCDLTLAFNRNVFPQNGHLLDTIASFLGSSTTEVCFSW